MKVGWPPWTPDGGCSPRCPAGREVPSLTGGVNYHSGLPATGQAGGALEPEPFNGRLLGCSTFRRVRPPVLEFALMGCILMLRRPLVPALLKLSPGRWSNAPRQLTWPPGWGCSGPSAGTHGRADLVW